MSNKPLPPMSRLYQLKFRSSNFQSKQPSYGLHKSKAILRFEGSQKAWNWNIWQQLCFPVTLWKIRKHFFGSALQKTTKKQISRTIELPKARLQEDLRIWHPTQLFKTWKTFTQVKGRCIQKLSLQPPTSPPILYVSTSNICNFIRSHAAQKKWLN